MNATGRIVRQGTWLYDGKIPVGVRIRATSTRYGSGDDADPPDIRHDQPRAGFSVEWERAGGGGWDGGFCTQHDTINEALAAVTVATGGTVKWSS
jgi:hypothetical protein